MNFDLLIDNLTNPALLFFVLGILAVYLKSDLEIPSNSSKFISLYLLFAIGFKCDRNTRFPGVTAFAFAACLTFFIQLSIILLNEV